MIKKKIQLFLLSSMVVFSLAACGDEDAQRDNNNDNISSMSTDSSSDKYPHTQPIRVQEAKYKYIVSQGKQDIKLFQQQQARQQPQPQQRAEQQAQQQAEQPAPTQPNQGAEAQQPEQQAQTPTQTQGNISQTEQRVIELTNAERRKQGLPDLKADTKLSQVAREKSKDMQAKGYFSHTSPTYGSPFDMMRDFGITYQSAGENIAQGQRSPEEVVQAWMNSEGHRKNILNPEFTHIGVGHETSENHWTQMFIKK